MASGADAAEDGAWKWAIRKRVWDALEADGVARDPRPVHHRIPNFDGGRRCSRLGSRPIADLLDSQ
ncbi:hypothetical protein HU200_059653 [Digitaria exilis]|uniref:Uncharacterized protein n=1 Tax=Digitaria exilis TaxID=1010633 RepID=A0A835ABC7_9POAL|nr:hypothetical protein HU200_059653 [Digitaria exilis]